MKLWERRETIIRVKVHSLQDDDDDICREDGLNVKGDNDRGERLSERMIMRMVMLITMNMITEMLTNIDNNIKYEDVNDDNIGEDNKDQIRMMINKKTLIMIVTKRINPEI